MQDQVLISIVTVSYNAVSTIEQTILSVINQTYPHIEYIIIDGGSTDGTVDVIKKYADKITYWVSEPDKGIYDAMNKGIAVATGEWINFMNAGDSYYGNDVLKKIFTQEQNADYLVGIASTPVGLWKPIRENFIFSEVYKGGAVNHQASFIRNALFTTKYDICNRIIADELFFLGKIVFEGKVYKALPFIICNYDNQGLSCMKESLVEIKRERDRFMEIHLPARILADYEESYVHKKVRMIRHRVVKKISNIIYNAKRGKCIN